MISLIGMGSGCPESLTAQGLAALQSAGLILGAKRLLEHLPAGCTDNCKAVYKPEDILRVLLHSRIRTPLFCTAATPGFTPVRQSCCPCCGLWVALSGCCPGFPACSF